MHFLYQHLAYPDSEIRVAVLNPGSLHEDIRIKFIGRHV
jgi:hypothetical protein